MRRFLQLGFVLALVAPSLWGGSWTVVQHVKIDDPSACRSSYTCTVTVSSTGSGHALVAFLGLYAVQSSSNTYYFSAGSAGGTWTRANSLEKSDNYSGSNWLSNCGGYVTSSSSGVTSITLTVANLTGSAKPSDWAGDLYELSWSGTTIAYDTANATEVTTACSSCSGQSLTLSGSNDAIVQGINPQNDCSSISGGAGYTTYLDVTTWGAAFAAAINTTNGAAPTWTCSSGRAVVGAIALSGSGGNSYTATPSETNTASDALARIGGFKRADSETNTAVDSLARLAHFGRGGTESNTASDAVAKLLSASRTMAETNAAGDALARLGSFARGDTETNTAGDTFVRAAGFNRSATEANATGDLLARRAGLGRGVSESYLAGDLLAAFRPNNTHYAVMSEVLSISDGLSRWAGYLRGDTEICVASDSLGRRAGYQRSEAETVITGDFLARLAGFVRRDTELSTASDAVIALGHHNFAILPRHVFVPPAVTKIGTEAGPAKTGAEPAGSKSGADPGRAKSGTAPGEIKTGTAPPH